jgi:hypothetical protein
MKKISTTLFLIGREMRNIFLLFLLAALSNTAVAEWYAVAGSELLTHYIRLEPNTSRGNTTKLWELYDYNKPREKSTPFLSEMAQYEYDCIASQRRKIADMFYSGNMGGGSLLHTDSNPGELKRITPGRQELLFEIACAPIPNEWEPAIRGKSGTITYVNAASILKSGNAAKIWSMTDYKIATHIDQYRFMSQIDRREYDCNTGNTRLIAGFLSTRNMGAGQLVVGNADPEGWRPVVSASVEETLMKIACGILVPH